MFPSGCLRCAASPKYFGTCRTVGLVTGPASILLLICLQHKLQPNLNRNHSLCVVSTATCPFKLIKGQQTKKLKHNFCFLVETEKISLGRITG